jgi:hypothetical protein
MKQFFSIYQKTWKKSLGPVPFASVQPGLWNGMDPTLDPGLGHKSQ